MSFAFFQHNPEDIINIDNGVGQSISISLSDFERYEPAYALPAGYTARYYIQGKLNALFDVNGNQFGEPLPYVNGNTYISKVTYYLANPLPPPTLDQAKADKIAAVYTIAGTTKAGQINYSTYRFDSSSVYSPNAIISYQALGATPSDFTFFDLISEEDVPISLSDLMATNNTIVQLYYACDKNANNLIETINSFTTITDVLNFDINTGWPTVPYTFIP